MKKILLLVFCSLFAAKNALATNAPALDDDFFQTILHKYQLTEADLKKSPEYKNAAPHIKSKINESSYCYRDVDGQVYGNHIHELRDIASTTKLFSSLFTLDAYGTQHQFNTFFYVIQSTDSEQHQRRYLFIQGSGDPTFDLAHLKTVYVERIKSYGKIDEVYFDTNFFAYIYAKNDGGKPSPHSNPGDDRVEQTKSALKSIFAFSKIQLTEATVEDFLNFKNEFEEVNPDIVSINEKSAPITDILKDMNKTSNNYSASVLYDSIPNKTQILLNSGFTEDELENEIRIYNGSGYPTNPTEVSRQDNKASCNAMLKLLDTISNCVGGECKLSQVFPRGCDEGSLCSRFKNDPQVKQSVIAKSGLTFYVISLAGWLDEVKQTPFAFLISTFSPAQRVRAKQAIDEMVSVIYQHTMVYPMLNEAESVSNSPEIISVPVLAPKN